MPDSLLVRPASPEDFSEWLELWKGYNAFYGRSGATALSEDVTRMTWIRFFDAYEPVHALVAERAGKLLGMAHYLFHRSTIMLGPTCYMQDLFTTPDARGQGVSKALMAFIGQHPDLQHLRRMMLATADAHELYRQFGFTALSKPERLMEKLDQDIYRKLAKTAG